MVVVEVEEEWKKKKFGLNDDDDGVRQGQRSWARLDSWDMCSSLCLCLR